ncbi:MAG: cytochrome b5 domain-containing protein [Bacillota bacterium]|nr:cytochrome b5 domain-containing protein [Bacillota bacterium]MDW7678450.1 cytochrome b5 domain-containing protein [Bacillota bacterium]
MSDDLPVFTVDELAEYDGKDGRSAYVAVDGLVYDFTELGRWSGGTHNGFDAGQDLTEALQNVSPHGERVLSRAPVVGHLAE